MYAVCFNKTSSTKIGPRVIVGTPQSFQSSASKLPSPASHLVANLPHCLLLVAVGGSSVQSVIYAFSVQDTSHVTKMLFSLASINVN